MIPHESPTPPRARFAGLDGLRAIAVALVVVYHLFPGWWVRGGFIGVDVFFVISGFLITSLLLREKSDTGRIGLVAFWRRRARRLLPALALVLVVAASAAWMLGGDILVGLGRQLLGAVTFSYNWASISAGADYFGADGSELFRNLWSLAVEEQFYLVWPVLLLLLLLLPRTWMRVAVVGALGAASAGWMTALVITGGATPASVGAEITRVYFGTDTHAFGLLLGVAVAFLWRAVSQREWVQRAAVRRGAAAVGIVATVGLIAVATVPQGQTIATFPGALLAASGLSAVAIVAGCWPGSVFGRVLDAAPLRWLGNRSYGLYLWHWPVLVLLVAAVQETGPDRPFPAWLGAVALAIALVATEASYRFCEMPVRRLGFRGSIRALGAGLRSGGRRRAAVVAAVAASVALLAGTVAGVVSAPAVSSGEAVVEAGMAALRDNPPAERIPAGPGVTGDQITAVGDSVMLASAPGLLARFPGIHVDAAVSRSMYAAPGILRDLAAAGQLRPYVVVALGTNGAISERSLDSILDAIGPDRQLVLVNAFAPRDWIAGVNTELSEYARTHPTVQVADWAEAIAPHPDLLAGDHIHPGEAGGRVFADAVADALEQAQRAQARSAEFAEQRRFAQELRQEQLFQPPGAPHPS
ncbi:acyltransferase family protein [Microbacterium sp. cx-59]|uniref:acyltransferase family protein n=1 Tax=Microbacterium sp. cx-59 TaxID=2891207 RepID=UPI001E400293|nr:acyltransferase family protein [Microbacterium sp. cx-59]MCC4908200.1 acetyltransferase [Microbacterium sp. cx-59]